MILHLYRAKDQPATRFKLDTSTFVDGVFKPSHHVVKHPGQRVFRYFKCRKKHYAKNMIAHSYYDGTYFFCAPGKGCKCR